LNANTANLKASQALAGRANKRPQSQINQFGGHIGGPIVKNRAFSFSLTTGSARICRTRSSHLRSCLKS
jgi:hypothetical protein